LDPLTWPERMQASGSQFRSITELSLIQIVQSSPNQRERFQTGVRQSDANHPYLFIILKLKYFNRIFPGSAPEADKKEGGLFNFICLQQKKCNHVTLLIVNSVE
jgi:hypothetical protein